MDTHTSGGESNEHVWILTGRFLEKGYAIDSLVPVLNAIQGMNRESLLQEKLLQSNEFQNSGVPFVTTYSLQHRSIKQIISRHWHIINNDRILKGASSLRNRVAPNLFDPPTRKFTFFDQRTGFYQCRRCRVCSLSSSTHRRSIKFESTSTQVQHTITPFITCSTVGVVYLLQCPCGLQYIGWTKRPLQVRLSTLRTSSLDLKTIQCQSITF